MFFQDPNLPWFITQGIATIIALAAGITGYYKSRLLAYQKKQLDSELGVLRHNQEKLLEEVRRENEKQKFVHSLQFKEEFDIYLKLWRNLVDFANVTNLRTSEPLVHIFKAEEQKVYDKQWANDFEAHWEKAYELINFHRPFYHQSVYKIVMELESMCRTTYGSILYPALFKNDPKPTMEDLNKKLDEICEVIRQRVGLISIEILSAK